ncbi:hypothetical protein DKT68_15190 [Micromonospora acroterricola]|uniref:Uncharacterized protein n=1 Tax=Micromonospora acroterricola TaxID=2202421 RepID=A0A317D1I6_9ACTN|nr:hypothetical protein [Micromonospora acroterricola]PWR08559.1 hypothetical protein DKT68_15190 [Micromonospora acroterricola]
MTLPIDPRDDQARIPQQPTPTQPQPTEPDTTPPRRASRRWPWIAAAVLVGLVAVGGLAYALMPSDEDEAVERCQAAISGQLKSPATAEYADDVTVSGEEGNFGTYYEVTGQVDAENGFGALVRGDYRCKVQREQDGSWTVTESSFDQR